MRWGRMPVEGIPHRLSTAIVKWRILIPRLFFCFPFLSFCLSVLLCCCLNCYCRRRRVILQSYKLFWPKSLPTILYLSRSRSLSLCPSIVSIDDRIICIRKVERLLTNRIQRKCDWRKITSNEFLHCKIYGKEGNGEKCA